MKIEFDAEFTAIANQIVGEGKTDDEWAKIESDDMFQRGLFVGGYDATEEEFCFSYETPKGEFWFQISLDEIGKVAKGELRETEGRPADL